MKHLFPDAIQIRFPLDRFQRRGDAGGRMTTISPTPDILDRRFYRRDPIRVARELLGQLLVRRIGARRLAGRIVETEAYLGVADRACHTYGGRRTARNETMWGDGGRLYVYFVYGMHYCANVVTGKPGDPTAVLLRAIEPVEGVDPMRRHRPGVRLRDLCSGPARMCQALGITRAMDGADLTRGDEIFIERIRLRPLPRSRVRALPRVGIGYAGDWSKRPLRFILTD